MAITAITPASSTSISSGDSFAFTIDDTYTSLVIKVQTASTLVVAYSTALGGAQAGYTVAVVDNGDGTHTVTTTSDAGWDVSPQLIYVVEDETGTEATTGLSYVITGETQFPQGSYPYNPINTTFVQSFKARTGSVVPAASDYDASEIDNDSTVTGTFVDDALNTLKTQADLSTTHNSSDGSDHSDVVANTARAPLSGAGAPGVSTGDGKALGHIYVDTTADEHYALVDATVGANVWEGAGGGGGAVSSVFTRTGAVVAVAGDYDDSEIDLAGVIGSPTYSTVQETLNNFHSVGVFTGGGVTDDGDGTITVAAGTGNIRATNSDTADLLAFDWAAEDGAGVALTTNSMNYIYIEYNAGTPQIIATTTKRTDYNTNIELATVYRYTGSDIHITDNSFIVGDHAGKMILRLEEVHGLTHETGSVVSETGTRNIAISQGTWWIGLTRTTTAAVDTSAAGTFNYYYSDGAGGFTEVASSTAINNTQYDDGSGSLATLANNQYGVHFVYVAQDGDVYVMYGTDSYTLSEAELAPAPGTLPPHFLEHHAHVTARIIILKSASSFTEIASAFTQTFAGSLAADHGGLAGLADDDHTQYSLVDGTRAFTGAIEVDSATAGVTVGEHSTSMGTPAAGKVNVYAKADGLMYSKDDAGTETLMSGGDVVGPASVTDNRIVTFDGTTGKLVQEAFGAKATTLGLVLDTTNQAFIAAERGTGPTGTAGWGYHWVKSDAPTTPHFQDDTNRDHAIVTDKGETAQDAVFFTERADHVNTPATGTGELWVRSDAPSVPVFTDDTGQDIELGRSYQTMDFGGRYIHSGTNWVGCASSYTWQDGVNAATLFGTGAAPALGTMIVAPTVMGNGVIEDVYYTILVAATTQTGSAHVIRHETTSGATGSTNTVVGSGCDLSRANATYIYHSSESPAQAVSAGDKIVLCSQAATNPTTTFLTATVRIRYD